MNKEERTSEILNLLTAFSNRRYKKAEYLSEMLKLQNQMADVAFKNKNRYARVWDVYNYLSQKNDECGNIADEELARFKNDCRDMVNIIRAEKSGLKGENLAYQSLEKSNTSEIILKNVELELDGVRTELDFVVFTKKAIFIVEVKNSKRDAFISEDGKYYRNGRFLCMDSNIGEKMKLREKLLRKVLNDKGYYKTNILSLLVFTDDSITVENNCRYIKTSFLSQLPHIIDRYSGWNLYTEERIGEMAEAVKEAELTGEYKPDMDTRVLKKDFAELVACLEYGKKKPLGFFERLKVLFSLKKAV